MPREYKAGSVEVEVALNDAKLEKGLKESERKAKESADRAGTDYERRMARRGRRAGIALGLALMAGIIYAFRGQIPRVLAALAPLWAAIGARTRTAMAALAIQTAPLRARMTRVFTEGRTAAAKFGHAVTSRAAHALSNLAARLDGMGGPFSQFLHFVARGTRLLGAFGSQIVYVAALWSQFKVGTLLGVTALIALGLAVRKNVEYTFARVKTLLKGYGPEVFEPLQLAIRELSNEAGIAQDKINNTLYQTLSAMPQLAEDTKAAMEVVSVATRVAATGFAEAEEAVRAITGILNAYKLRASEAESVADALFAAQDQGVTTFGEMAQEIGRVTGLASALGGDWKDLLAIVATNTPFINTSETITQIESVLAGVLEVTPKAALETKKLGLEFSATALRAKGLIPFLRDVIDATGGDPESIAALFGRREAVQLIVTLAGNLEELTEKQKKVADTTGTLNENVDIMNVTLQRHLEIVGAKFKNTLELIGKAYEDFAKVALGSIGSVLEALQKADQAMSEHGAPRGLFGLPRPFTLDAARFFGAALLTAEDVTTGMIEGAQERMRNAWWRERARFGLYQAHPEATLEPIDVEVNLVGEALDLIHGGLPEWADTEGLITTPEPPHASEEALEALDELQTRLESLATVEHARTGDLEQYKRAMRSAKETVNEHAIAEYERARAMGVSAKEAARFLQFYTQLENLAEKRRAERRNAQARARQGLQATVLAESFGLDPRGRDHETARAFIGEIAQVDNEIQRHGRNLKGLTALQREFWDVLSEIGDLQRYRADLVRLARTELDLSAASETLNQNITDFVRNLGVTDEAAGDIRSTIAGLATITNAIVAQQNNLYSAQLQNDTERAKAAKDALTGLQAQLQQALAAAASRFESLGLRIPVLQRLLELLEKVRTEGGADEEATFWDKLPEYASTIEGVARGVLSVANAMGVLSDETERVLRGVIDLAEGIGRIAAGDVVGGIAQGVGGLAGLVSGLFGESEAERKRRMLLEDNTRELKALRESLDEQRRIVLSAQGADIARAQEAFAAVGAPPGGGWGDLAEWGLDAVRALHSLGIGFEDMQRWLDDLGIRIKILNDEGELVPDALRQATEALRELSLEDVFGTTFEGEMDRLQTLWNLTDMEDAGEKLQAYYDLLRKYTNLDVPEFDLDTAEGRAAFEEWAAQLIANFGDLTFGELDQLTAEQLRQLLETIEGTIDEISVDEAARSFQAFRGITEVTANRMAGLLSTDVVWNRRTAESVERIEGLLRGLQPTGPRTVADAPRFENTIYIQSTDPVLAAHEVDRVLGEQSKRYSQKRGYVTRRS